MTTHVEVQQLNSSILAYSDFSSSIKTNDSKVLFTFQNAFHSYYFEKCQKNNSIFQLNFLINNNNNTRINNKNRVFLSFSLSNSPDGRAFGGAKAPAGSGCQRCGFPVYEAEKMISKNRHWHKRCFSCHSCHKSLDSTNLCDAPDNEIYW